MQSHEYSQPGESEFSVNGNSEASTAEGNDKQSLDSNTQLNDDSAQNTSRVDESPEGSNNENPDSQLPYDEAREEAWAVHNAKTSAAQDLGRTSNRLLKINQARETGDELAFAELSNPYIAQEVRSIEGDQLQQSEEELIHLKSELDDAGRNIFGDNYKADLDFDKQTSNISDTRSEQFEKYRSLGNEYRELQSYINNVKAGEIRRSGKIGEQFKNALGTTDHEGYALRDTIDDLKNKVLIPFDRLKEANPDRYKSLNSDELRAWVEAQAMEEATSEYWAPKLDNYRQQIEILQTAIDNKDDLLSRRIIGENVLRDGTSLDKFTVFRSTSEQLQRVFGISGEELDSIRPFIDSTLQRLGDEAFELSPKDRLEIWKSTFTNLIDALNENEAKNKATQDALFERFRNNEGIKAPTPAETNQ